MAAPNSKTSDLMNAVRAGNLDGVLLAIGQGADIEEADMHGYPGLPLRTASFSGHLDIVLALLTHGADVNAPTADGNGAPLRLARRAKHQAIANLLLERGAEIPYDGKADSQALDIAKVPPPPESTAESTAPPPAEEAIEPSPSGIPGDLRRQPRPESNLIEFTAISVPIAPTKAASSEDHGNSIEFTHVPITPPASEAPLPDFSAPPPAPAEVYTLPKTSEIEEIEMSLPYGVDTEILEKELARLDKGAEKPKN